MKLHDQRLLIANAMIKYGGGFVRELAHALVRADAENTQKIKDTWPVYWRRYFILAEKEEADDTRGSEETQEESDPLSQV